MGARYGTSLLLYTGQRGGDVVRMRRQDISEGTITVVQEKTGTELSIPIHPNLEAAIKAGPSHIHYLIVGQNGRPMTRKALTDMMKRAVKAAGLGAECVPHGLRKAILRRLAERGSTTKEIAAVSGHKTLREVERYTAAADQRRLSAAAIKKLWGE
jgi:integrase